jgi:AraC family transcriptional regulator, transcriptional activator of pobA
MTRAAAEIPAFSLYGEAPGGLGLSLHIETIAARSRRHQWRIGAHLHRGLHQVLWVAEGPVTTTLGAETEAGVGPLAIVIPPGVAHGFTFSPRTRGFVLTFDPRTFIEGEGETGATFADLFAAPRVVSLREEPDAARRLTGLLADLAAEAAAPEAALSPAPLWLARAALWRLARLAGAERPQGAGRATFARFVALVEARFRDGWPVSAYAAALGLSAKRLNRLTRAHAGMSAQDCMHRRLLREACERLAHLDAPVSAIGFDLGFDDPAYFTRFFKRLTGESPRAFRAARRGEVGR